MRVILFTGKGGVGKTTIAASTAVRSAAAGQRTLIMSTDPAHSLADAFEVVIGNDPTEIEPNLWAQQVDAQERLEDNWREIQDYMVQVMNWAGTETIQAEELTVIPGIDEIFALIDVKTHVESGAYDAAFFLRGTPVSQIREIAAAGVNMPPKSTFFTPKVPTGLLFNPLS